MSPLPNLTYINKYLAEPLKVLDVGCGAGAYSLELAKKGHEVTALDPVPKHVEQLKQLDTANKINASVGDDQSMDAMEDASFNAILCMGPFYHIDSAERKRDCPKNCHRLLTKDGVVFVALIAPHPKAIMDLYIAKRLKNITPDSMRAILNNEDPENSLFYSDQWENICDMAQNIGFDVLHVVGSEGISRFLDKPLAETTEQGFETYITYHLEACEDKSLIGHSLHQLLVLKKTDQ